MTRRAFIVSNSDLTKQLLQESLSESDILIVLGKFWDEEIYHADYRISLYNSSSFLTILEKEAITEVIFSAKANAGALIYIRYSYLLLKDLARGRWSQLSAENLINILISELKKMNIQIRSIKDIMNEKVSLTAEDAATLNANRSSANLVREWHTSNKAPSNEKSIFTVPEAFILGVDQNGKVIFEAREKYSTDELIKSTRKINKDNIRELILVKKPHSDAMINKIVQPVIGVKTIELAIQYGISKIFIDEFCTIQGKDQVIQMCKENGIMLGKI